MFSWKHKQWFNITKHNSSLQTFQVQSFDNTAACSVHVAVPIRFLLRTHWNSQLGPNSIHPNNSQILASDTPHTPRKSKPGNLPVYLRNFSVSPFPVPTAIASYRFPVEIATATPPRISFIHLPTPLVSTENFFSRGVLFSSFRFNYCNDKQQQ